VGVRRGGSFDINGHGNMVVRRVENHQSLPHLVIPPSLVLVIPNEVRDLHLAAHPPNSVILSGAL
jgi:hypothetical protein